MGYDSFDQDSLFAYYLEAFLMADTSAQGITWDLTSLFTDQNKIKDHQQLVEQKITEFNQQFGSTIDTGIEPARLRDLLKQYSTISELAGKSVLYASLRFAADKSDSEVTKLYQQQQEFAANCQTQLLWVELQLSQLPSKTFQTLLSSQELADYRYFLEQQQKMAPHTLSQAEEEILVQKRQTGTTAWRRLYTESFARLSFTFEQDGKQKQMTFEEIAAIFKDDPKRERRQSAYHAMSKGLEPQKPLFAFILNTLLLDKSISDKLRDFSTPQQATYLSSDTPQPIIQALTEAVQSGYPMVSRYYQRKKELLGYDQLHEWDRYSPLFPDQHQELSWDGAKKMVLESFHQFSPQVGEQAERFFSERWIDAEIRQGKTSGAFCSLGTTKQHPYVLVNFTGELGEAMTLAHEIGHGLHALQSQQQPFLHFYPSTPVAESASTFSELLLFDRIIRELPAGEERQALLAHKIEGTFAGIFRQIDFHLFESQLHQHRREQGELAPKDIDELWQQQVQKMFGDSLTLTDAHRNGWIPVLHFFKYHFYVYSYSFAELLSLALYDLYQEQGQDFVPQYLDLLSRGGSQSPQQMIRQTVGLDIAEASFWQRGLNVLGRYVNEFREGE